MQPNSMHKQTSMRPLQRHSDILKSANELSHFLLILFILFTENIHEAKNVIQICQK